MARPPRSGDLIAVRITANGMEPQHILLGVPVEDIKSVSVLLEFASKRKNAKWYQVKMFERVFGK